MTLRSSDPRLTILSSRGDHHGAVVAGRLRQLRQGDLDVRIVDMDAASTNGGINWQMGPQGENQLMLKDQRGRWFDFTRSDLVWCRRFSRPQLHDDAEGGLTIQWRQATKAIAATMGPIWRDHPDAILAAESKPAQLMAARQVGLNAPDTLVSQDPQAIREFFEVCDGQMIVKPVKGHLKRQMLTVQLTAEALQSDEALGQFPAIYQRMISGQNHVRIVVLEQEAQAFAIRSSDLDWRRRQDLTITQAVVPDAVIEQLRAILRKLDLTMGVFDAKYDTDGTLWFLEVNPQGQFFFLEALGDVDLAAMYARNLQRSLVSKAGLERAI